MFREILAKSAEACHITVFKGRYGHILMFRSIYDAKKYLKIFPFYVNIENAEWIKNTYLANKVI